MNSFLREVLAAHDGIDGWERYRKVSATIVSGGDLFDAKGIKPDTTPRKVSAATKRERMTADLTSQKDRTYVWIDVAEVALEGD